MPVLPFLPSKNLAFTLLPNSLRFCPGRVLIGLRPAAFPSRHRVAIVPPSVIRATTSNPTIVRVALLVVLAAGAFLRLNALGAKTIRQDETYVPNISLPDGASDPAPRKTLVATLTGSMWDVHPPTWYLAMWFWTKVFGTTLYAMRFPSALFGTLAIALTFAIARLESDSTTALIAAALVAFNGLQILWSQIARQYTWVCCLGLCATWFLLLAIREPTRRTIWLCLYGLSSLGGLLSLYYFWPLFAAHVIWAIVTRHEARLGFDASSFACSSSS